MSVARLRPGAAAALVALVVLLGLACDSADAPTIAPSSTPTPTPSATATPTPTPGGTHPATPAAAPSAVPTAATGEPYDDSTDPITLLASLYDALNRGDFARAYGYFDTPPAPSIEAFATQYASTKATLLAVAPPPRIGAAAGSEFAEIPAMTLAVDASGSLRTFGGCFTARRANPSVDLSASAGWRISMTTLVESPGPFPDAAPLETGCAAFAVSADPPLYDDQAGPANVVASLVNAINRKEFERAYTYWAQPPDGQTLEKYIEGFAETEHILLALAAPTTPEMGTTRLRADLPALLVATRTAGVVENYFGCYTVARAADDPAAPWELLDRRVFETANADLRLLIEVCSEG